jgi:hypothetical protein
VCVDDVIGSSGTYGEQGLTNRQCRAAVGKPDFKLPPCAFAD